MKKLVTFLPVVGFFAGAASVFAQTPSSIPIRLNPPPQGINPFVSIGSILSSVLTIIFVLAAIVVLFMLVFGAFQWIMSGGDKEAVGKARDRITHALIGLAILALAFLITQVVGQVVNIPIFNLQALPVLGQCNDPNLPVFDPTTGRCIAPRVSPAP